MDRKRVKRLVIEKNWDDKKDTNEYRSFSRQIDNRIKAIEDNHPFFAFYPIDLLSDEQIADLISNLVCLDSTKNRKIFSKNAKSSGLTHQYTDIQYPEEYSFRRIEETNADSDDYLGNGRLSSFSLLVCNNIIREATPQTYKTSLLAIQRAIHEHTDILQYQITKHKILGLVYLDNDNLEEFVSLADSVFRGIYLYIILGAKIKLGSISSLDKLSEIFTKLETVFKKESANIILKYKGTKEFLDADDNAIHPNLGYEESKRFKQSHKDWKLNNLVPIFNLDVLTAKHRSYLGFVDFIEECDRITDKLSNEIAEKPDLFIDLYDKTEKQKLKTILSGGRHIHDFETKLNTTEKIIKYAAKHNNQYFDDQDPATKKILFQELWVRPSVTSPSEKQQSGTIVKIILGNQTKKTSVKKNNSILDQTQKEQKDAERKEEMARRVAARQRLFLDEKFIRGFFCVHGMLDMYSEFLKIRRQFRKSLLSVFLIHDASLAYEDICSLIDEYLRFILFYMPDEIKGQEVHSVSQYLDAVKFFVRHPEAKETDSLFPYKSHSGRPSD